MAPVEVAIRRSATAVAKSTPGAIGSRETRSGEFCKGMMLFMSYFHVAHALFMDTGILHLTGRSCHDNKSQRADPLLSYPALLRVNQMRKGSFFCSDPP